MRWLWPNFPLWVECELASLPTLCLDSIVSPLQDHCVKDVSMVRCNLPSALLAEWLWSFMCHCCNMGVERVLKRQHRKSTLEQKILPLLLPGLGLKTLGHESRALPTELFQLPVQSTWMPIIEAVEQNLVMINQWEDPQHQCVLALFPFLTGAKISKKLCLVFVYVLYKFVSGLVLWVWGNLWFDDLCAEWSKADWSWFLALI